MTLTVADVASQGSAGSGGSPGRAGPRAGQRARRTFTAAYKMKIIDEFERSTDHDSRGALLRREGLYHSHVLDWRKARDAGALGALSSAPGPAKLSPDQSENRRLRAGSDPGPDGVPSTNDRRNAASMVAPPVRPRR